MGSTFWEPLVPLTLQSAHFDSCRKGAAIGLGVETTLYDITRHTVRSITYPSKALPSTILPSRHLLLSCSKTACFQPHTGLCTSMK